MSDELLNSEENDTVTLTLDDDTEIVCDVITIFTCGESQYIALLPQDSGAAAVVGHSDDGGEILGVFFQPPQHGGQPRPAADGDNPGSPLPLRKGGVCVTQCRSSFPSCRASRPPHIPVALGHRPALGPDFLRQGVGNGHRAVVAAGAAHRDDQGGLARLLISGQQPAHQVPQAL